MSSHATDSAYVIPGDAIETSPEWVSATRRAFPLLPDAIIAEGFEDLREANQIYQDVLDMQVDAEAEHDACGCEKCHPERHGFAGAPPADWPGYEC